MSLVIFIAILRKNIGWKFEMFNFSRIHGCFKLMIPGFDLFLVRNKNKVADNVIFDKTISISFGLEECEELSSYKRSLVNSDMEWTDNIYKQLRESSISNKMSSSLLGTTLTAILLSWVFGRACPQI